MSIERPLRNKNTGKISRTPVADTYNPFKKTIVLLDEKYTDDKVVDDHINKIWKEIRPFICGTVEGGGIGTGVSSICTKWFNIGEKRKYVLKLFTTPMPTIFIKHLLYSRNIEEALEKTNIEPHLIERVPLSIRKSRFNLFNNPLFKKLFNKQKGGIQPRLFFSSLQNESTKSITQTNKFLMPIVALWILLGTTLTIFDYFTLDLVDYKISGESQTRAYINDSIALGPFKVIPLALRIAIIIIASPIILFHMIYWILQELQGTDSEEIPTDNSAIPTEAVIIKTITAILVENPGQNENTFIAIPDYNSKGGCNNNLRFNIFLGSCVVVLAAFLQ